MPDQAEVSTVDGYRGRISEAVRGLGPDAGIGTVWSALGKAGALAGLYPAGAVDPVRLGALLRAIDARGDNGITLSVLVQAASAVPLLGAEAKPDTVLAAVHDRALAGGTMLALAATDAAAPGSDLAGLGTEIAADGGELRLSGEKRWITSAGVADELLVLAKHGPGRHFTNFTWVLVPSDAPGVRITPSGTSLLAGSATAHIEFDRVRLDPGRLVGRRGRGLASFALIMGSERLGGALWAVAMTGRVLADTHERLRRREIDGADLAENAAVRQDLARCLVRVHQLRALAEVVGEDVVAGQGFAEGAMLKAAVGPAVDEVLSRCAQLQGADGYRPGGAQWIRAEAGVFGIGGGTTELMLEAVADALEPLLGKARS
ncbi:acyl-CoA dehydrogenase family protein [Amycolatopsis sp. WGS_07]|uniref:acyl-CoA dehydrogenase family protein n=1 Tax=Amycolatopsis sp. WGS_07 TaxID=3076764 RepID=UPI003872B758